MKNPWEVDWGTGAPDPWEVDWSARQQDDAKKPVPAREEETSPRKVGGRGTDRPERRDQTDTTVASGRSGRVTVPASKPAAGEDQQGWGEWAVDTAKKVPGALYTGLLALPEVGAHMNRSFNEVHRTLRYPVEAGVATLGNATGLFNYDPDEAAKQDEAYWRRGVDDAANRRDEARPEHKGTLQEGVLGALESLPTSLLALGTGVATGSPNAALSIMGMTTGVPAYSEARMAGKDFMTSLKYGIEQGGVEVLTEKIPASDLISDVAMKSPFGKILLKQLAEEIPGEQVATLLQDMSEWATMNPDKPVSEFIAERPSAAAQTLIATITGTAVQTGLVAGLDKGLQKVQSRGEKIEAEAKVRAAASITPEDEASPLDTDMIKKGRESGIKAELEATTPQEEETIFDPANLPPEAMPFAYRDDEPEKKKAKPVLPKVTDIFDRMVQITIGTESNGRRYGKDGKLLEGPQTKYGTAKGEMQVLDGTNTDPGFGVRPAKDNSPEERARVGRDYVAAMLRRYGNDPAKAWAAYNWGPGNLDNAIKKYGEEWLDHAPVETRKYVMKNLSELGSFDAEGNVAPVELVREVEREDTLDFARRVFGEDFLSGNREESATGLAETGEGMVGAMGDNLRQSLMEKIDRGETEEGGQPSALLQVAKTIKDEGGLIDVPAIERINAAISTARASGDYQTSLRQFIKGELEANRVPAATEAETPKAKLDEVKIEPTPSGKGIAVLGATDEQLAAIAEALPNAKAGMRRNDGAVTYSKKHEAAIRELLKVSPANQAGENVADGSDLADAARAQRQSEAERLQVKGGKINDDFHGFTKESGTIGIPRSQMPQIKAEHRGAMVQFMKGQGITHEEITVPAIDLKPTQDEFSPAKVQQAKDYEGGNRAILISKDGYILDGHHQWLAARDNGEEVRAIRLDAPIRKLIDKAHEFPSSTVSEGATENVTPQQDEQPDEPKRLMKVVDQLRAIRDGKQSLSGSAIRALSDLGLIESAGGTVQLTKKGDDRLAELEAKDGEAAARRREIDDGFAENRKVMNNFKKGDRVEYTHESFYRDGSGRTFLGEVVKISSKDQGIIEVRIDGGGDVYVQARVLRKAAEEVQPATPEKKEEAAPVAADDEALNEKRRGEREQWNTVVSDAKLQEAAVAGRDTFDRAIALTLSDQALAKDEDFLRSAYKEARRRKILADREKGRDPAIYQLALAKITSEADIPEGTQAEFKSGFDHALAGRTKSTITGAVKLQGYEAARNWIKTEEGRNFYEGKRGKKLENTGAALRRHFDKANDEIEGADGEWKSIVASVIKATNRANLFNPDLESATPGAQRMADTLRDQLRTFREFANGYMGVSQISSYSYGAQRRRTRGGPKLEDRLYEDESKAVAHLKSAAHEYIGLMEKVTAGLTGAKTVADLSEKIRVTFFGEDAEPQNHPTHSFNERVSGVVNDSYGKKFGRIIRSLAGLNSSQYDTTLKSFIDSEQTENSSSDRRKPLTRPKLDKITRNGLPDYRNGKDISPQQFKDAFGFADVQMGKWVKAGQDQDHLNYAYDSFMDLANVLGIAPKAISLGGTLHISFGALGHGRHAAHYQSHHPHPEGGEVPVINITNTKGDGALSHEWFHALDFALRPNDRDRSRRSGQQGAVRRLTARLTRAQRTKENIEKEVLSFLHGGQYYPHLKNRDPIVQARYHLTRISTGYNGLKTTAYKSNADKLGKDYWGNPEELFARAAEAWMFDALEGRDARDNYLVSDWVAEDAVTEKMGYRGRPYPAGEERQKFAALFDALFKSIEFTDNGPQFSDNDQVEALIEQEGSDISEFVADLDKRIPELRAEIVAEKEQRRRNAAFEKQIGDAAEDVDVVEIEEQPDAITSDGPLDEDELAALFDEAAAEMREAAQETPETPEPGDLDALRGKGESNPDQKIAERGQMVSFLTPKDGRQRGKVVRVRKNPEGRTIYDIEVEGIGLQNAFADEARVVTAAPSNRAESKPDQESAGRLAAEAAKLGVKGIDEALSGLIKLFGNPNTLRSFPAFSEEDYQKAKPHFEASLKAFIEAGKTLKDLFKFLIQNFGEGIRPYAIKFAQEKSLGVNLSGEAFTQETAEDTPKGEPEAQSTPTPSLEGLSELEAAFTKAFADGQSFQNLTARKFARDLTGRKFEAGTEEVKELDEVIEAAILRNARAIATDRTATPQQAYERLVALYEQQPKLTVRTSTSVIQQAYSTPVPLAYLASRLAGITEQTSIYEPTAGNGALLIAASDGNITANELNQARAKQLQAIYPGATVTQADALKDGAGQGQFDVVIANPPFGVVSDETNAATIFQVDGEYSTREIDHAIAMKALEKMKDGGRAVLIVGGLNKQITDPKKRADAYNGKAKREFYFKLYSQYNVTDHFTVDGALYERQGAGWPVDVIVINGRGKSSLTLPAVKAPRQYADWTALAEKLDDRGRQTSGTVRGEDRNDTPPQLRPETGDERDIGELGERGDNRRGGGNQEGQSEPLRGRPAVGEPDGIRVGAERSQVDQTAEDQQSAGRSGRTAPVSDTEENDRQVTYQPGSKANPMQTLVPVNMGTAVRDAMERLQARHGDIDKFVSERLGYDPGELSDYFGAEQVDALALAIDNMESGAGFIIGDQCVAGETPIYDPVAQTYTPIKDLAEIGNPITVLSLTREGYEPRPASAPFLKGRADLYRVTLDDGSSIIVTEGHRFLSDAGWVCIRSGLVVGARLISTSSPAALSLDSVVSSLPPYAPAGARRWMGEVQDCQDRCSSDHHHGDEPLLSGEAVGQFCAPSLSDARGYSRYCSQTGGQDLSQEHSHRSPSSDHHSKNSSYPTESRDPSLTSIPERALSASLSEPTRQGQPPFGPYSTSLHPEGGADVLDRSMAKGRKFSSSSVDDTGLRCVVSITFERHDDFYDMHVPGAYNYVANQLVNHNTGIGKGRVVAGILRYAIRSGRNPIFVTEKPNLYRDMYRDIKNIGIPAMLGREPNIVMTNSGEKIALNEEETEFLSSGSPAKHKALLSKLAASGNLAKEGVDILFTTYNQMQTVKGEETVRQAVVERLSEGGIVVMDESHNAGGQGDSGFASKNQPRSRAKFMREIVNKAHGVLYSSATYAKRPDVMDLYSATDMKMAVPELNKLGEIISKGGVPMQQVVAAMLSRAGQYIRRERSFEGINYNTPVAEIDAKKYSDTAEILASIQDFSEIYVKAATSKIDEQIRSEGKTVNKDNATGQIGAKSTTFTSIMHNIVDQMLLAFKADESANIAIAAIQRGEKPVITVANTLEAFIKKYITENDIKVGEPIDITFADVFRHYLERSRVITVKKPFAKKGDKGEKIRLTDAQIGQQGVAAFNAAMDFINGSNLNELPGSPLDYIIGRIRDAGYSVGEITGRGLGIDYEGGKAILKNRPTSETSIEGRLKAITGFNNGNIDAILLNRSGSTGLSLHASEEFKDQRKRRMIIAQAEGNIDTHMQMLGRIHRTGQVVLPEYDQIVAGVPAEKRPAAVLAKKMASLNANTTASRDSALTSSEVLDFMNEYGDEIAARIMEDDDEIHMRLGSPLNEEDGVFVRDGAARKVTGRIPLLPVAMQEELYQRLEDGYRALLKQKDAAGENALEAKTLDLDAVSLERIEAIPASNAQSPFGEGVYVETMDVKSSTKPFSTSDVLQRVADTLGVKVGEGTNFSQLVALERYAMNKDEFIDTVRDGVKFINDTVANITDEKAKTRTRERYKASVDRFGRIIRTINIGSPIRLKMESGNFYGVITNIRKTGKSKNPVALGSWTVTVALANGNAKSMDIPFSQLDVTGDPSPLVSIIGRANKIGETDVIDSFDQLQNDLREERSIITGNLLSGFDYAEGKGTIINFSMSDGGIRQGIMLRRGFNFEKFQAERAVLMSEPAAILDLLDQFPHFSIVGNGGKGDISVIKAHNSFLFTTAKSKAAGGEFFTNTALTAALGKDFVSSSTGMMAQATRENSERALGVLIDGGVRFEIAKKAKPEIKEAARKLVDAARGKQSRFSKVIPGAPATYPQAEYSDRMALKRELKAELDKLGIGDKVVVDVVDSLFFGSGKNKTQAAGDYFEQVIRIASQAGVDGRYTLNHEVIHALKELGLFKEEEWRALERAARGDAALMKRIKSAYPDLAEIDQVEEAIAEMFAAWRTNRQQQKGFVRDAFRRIADLFDALRSALSKVPSTRSVFRDIERGNVGGRSAATPVKTGDGFDIFSVNNPAPKQQRLAAEEVFLSNDKSRMGEMIDTWRTKLQDKMLPLLRTQQRIEAQTARSIADQVNPYLQEEVMSGRVGAEIEYFTDEYVQPLFDAMGVEKVTVDELETYVYARHAPERNARISEINPEFEEGTGSGMSDAEATAIIEQARAEGKIEALNRLAEKLDAILSYAMDRRVESGLLSEEEAEAWRETYRHYVPLRGSAELEPENATDHPRFGSGINVRGKESKRAFGRKSKARDILAYSIMQAEEAIMRAGHNEVAKAFYEIAKSNKDSDFWTTSKVTRKPVFDKKTGTVKYQNQSRIQPEDEPYTITAKIDGQERRVTINRHNPEAVKLAESMRNLNGMQMGSILNMLSKINRALSYVNTALNPEFIITNGFRDLQTAGINLLGVDQEKIIRKTVADWLTFKPMAAVWRGARKTARDAEWDRWNREFTEEGGRVYYNRLEDLNTIRKRIEKHAAETLNGGPNAAWGTIMAVKGAIDNANLAVENAIRLAVYKNAREGGMSKAKAASLAKNLTVNFNRRGAWGVALNSLYLFYNAGVQGSARTITALGNKRVRRFVYAAMVFGFLLDMLNSMFSGDDDDGESYYDKVSDYDKSRNLVVMWGGDGGHIKIPLPYGYNVFYAIGRAASEINRGKRWEESSASLLKTILDSFNPIGGTESLLNFVSPTIGDPFVDVLVDNRDYADRPIMPDQNPYSTPEPDSQRYWGSVNPNYRKVAELLNSGTGGDEVTPGAIDISPETMDYLVGYATGAAGTFISDRILGTGMKLINGEEVKANDIPLARKVLGDKPGWYDKAAYYSRIEEIKAVDDRVGRYEDLEKFDKADDYAVKNDELMALVPDMKDAQKQLREIRKSRAQIELDEKLGLIDSAAAKDEYKALRADEDAVITDFNSLYIATVSKPKGP